jgi:hypothetical protein
MGFCVVVHRAPGLQTAPMRAPTVRRRDESRLATNLCGVGGSHTA